ncbi:hypothetical protein Cgig2_026438 [Carnegiea gigantea]|uniref:Reverse transcriptase domain-containing protein n=1 Tax=Carnegiea gigantea TaxID=171969 RepID=A0A9Q1QNV3_9CARY|nr:hypothetical protein Cgig2_026438 [Carnegiea gigantea]
MSYISMIKYSFIINGVVKRAVKPTPRFRQGDPISSYLFLMCAKAFPTLITKVIQKIHGVIIYRVHCRANEEEFSKITRIIDTYEKSSLNCYCGVEEQYQGNTQRIKESCLQWSKEGNLEKDTGLARKTPTEIGRGYPYKTEHLCLLKHMGGMRFRDLIILVKAMLTKQGRRILTNCEFLLSHTLTETIFSPIVDARRGFDPYYTWRLI